jgi:hypothetical protein
MTRVPRISGAWRWALVPSASLVAFYFALYVNLLLLFSPFPRPLAEPVAGFAMPSLIIVAGSFAAPSHRVAVAALLGVVGALPASLWLELHPIGACAGALLAVGLVAWWWHPRRTRVATRRVGFGAAVFLVGFIVLVYAFYSGRLDRSDSLPPALSQALGGNAAHVGAFYLHDLGGFIDSQSLWRIDAKPDVVELVIKELDLQSTQTVPQQFWRMPPYYWPRSRSASAEAFQSRCFLQRRAGSGRQSLFLDPRQDESKRLRMGQGQFLIPLRTPSTWILRETDENSHRNLPS